MFDSEIDRIIPSEISDPSNLSPEMRARFLATLAFVDKDPDRRSWHMTVPIDDVDFATLDSSLGGLDTTYDLDGTLLEGANPLSEN